MEKLCKVLDIMRKDVEKDWSLNQARIFLEIAVSGEITQQKLGELLKLPQGTISRNCRTLSQFADNKTGEIVGYDLIYMIPDLYASRQLACRLSPKGGSLFRKIKEVFEK